MPNCLKRKAIPDLAPLQPIVANQPMELSVQGRNFESELISELCKLAHVEKVHTTPYYPMTNGQCERFNSTLCNMLGTLPEKEKNRLKGTFELYDSCL